VTLAAEDLAMHSRFVVATEVAAIPGEARLRGLQAMQR